MPTFLPQKNLHAIRLNDRGRGCEWYKASARKTPTAHSCLSRSSLFPFPPRGRGSSVWSSCSAKSESPESSPAPSNKARETDSNQSRLRPPASTPCSPWNWTIKCGARSCDFGKLCSLSKLSLSRLSRSIVISSCRCKCVDMEEFLSSRCTARCSCACFSLRSLILSAVKKLRLPNRLSVRTIEPSSRSMPKFSSRSALNG
mmetsp:Transcript_16011/g.37759  ORF Transcript_16011/g.37759 Transcript_16011/m.37759 type:complete len:201 (+) Transcript_16011:902-1504(+)